MSQVVSDVLKEKMKAYVSLVGPSFATEVAQGKNDSGRCGPV